MILVEITPNVAPLGWPKRFAAVGGDLRFDNRFIDFDTADALVNEWSHRAAVEFDAAAVEEGGAGVEGVGMIGLLYRLFVGRFHAHRWEDLRGGDIGSGDVTTGRWVEQRCRICGEPRYKQM